MEKKTVKMKKKYGYAGRPLVNLCVCCGKVEVPEGELVCWACLHS